MAFGPNGYNGKQVKDLTPLELVGMLAEGIKDFNAEERNAAVNQLKEYNLYHDLGVTLSDGKRLEKGYVNVGNDVYLRGETKPATPDEITRYVAGVKPPKKPSGFFSGLREWWHNHVSKLDDFTKYEQKAKEYEITKYYACKQAGLAIEKSDTVKQYEKELAADKLINERFEALKERAGIVYRAGITDKDKRLFNPLDLPEAKQVLKDALLSNVLLDEFVERNSTQEYLQGCWGEKFSIFGENGRTLPEISARTKSEFVSLGRGLEKHLGNAFSQLSQKCVEEEEKHTKTVDAAAIKIRKTCESGGLYDCDRLVNVFKAAAKSDWEVGKSLVATIPNLSMIQLDDLQTKMLMSGDRVQTDTINKHARSFITDADMHIPQGLSFMKVCKGYLPEPIQEKIAAKYAEAQEPYKELMNILQNKKPTEDEIKELYEKWKSEKFEQEYWREKKPSLLTAEERLELGKEKAERVGGTVNKSLDLSEENPNDNTVVVDVKTKDGNNVIDLEEDFEPTNPELNVPST